MTTDPAMEIACTLPCEPRTASLIGLAREFNVTGARKVTALLATLAQVKTKVAQSKGGGYHVCIPRRQWRAAQRICEKYWRAVYGE